MSIKIVNDHPFTAVEIQYLQDRNQHELLEQNRIQYPPGSEQAAPDVGPENEPTLELSKHIYDHVAGLDESALKGELKEAGLPQTGDVSVLKVRLATHLQEQENAKGANATNA